MGSVRPDAVSNDPNESVEIPISQRFSEMAAELAREERIKKAEQEVEEIQLSTKHQILFPTLKDALVRLDNPMVQQRVAQLAGVKHREPDFKETYQLLRESSQLWLIGLADFLDKKRIRLDFLATGRPDIGRKSASGAEYKWIIVNCTRDSLDSVSPKVQVVPAKPDSISRAPKEIDLYDVFAANDFF